MPTKKVSKPKKAAAPKSTRHDHYRELMAMFVGGAITVLALQGSLNTLLAQATPRDAVDCATDQDCEGPTMICSQNACVPMVQPLGQCTQPMVLTYRDEDGHTKNTYCDNGCRITPQGAQCI